MSRFTAASCSPTTPFAETGRGLKAGCAALVLLGLNALQFVHADPASSVFMRPDGSDDADGRTAVTAVKSLSRALEIGIAASGTASKSIAIEVGEGTYKRQHASIAVRPDDMRIVIRPHPSGSKVVFDGDGKGGALLTVRPSVGGGISIRDFEITNYVTAISLAGSRGSPDDPAKPVEGVEITGNQFTHIGQIAFPRGKPSTAVLRLVNADKTRIVGNRFFDTGNVESCELLHAIYIAHDSTENLIEANNFEKSCGDSIRIRDKSNHNVIKGNTFTDAWAVAPISDWFCNNSLRKRCANHRTECPSVGNVLAGNKVVARNGKKADLVKSLERQPNSQCKPDHASKYVER